MIHTLIVISLLIHEPLSMSHQTTNPTVGVNVNSVLQHPCLSTVGYISCLVRPKCGFVQTTYPVGGARCGAFRFTWLALVRDGSGYDDVEAVGQHTQFLGNHTDMLPLTESSSHSLAVVTSPTVRPSFHRIFRPVQGDRKPKGSFMKPLRTLSLEL